MTVLGAVDQITSQEAIGWAYASGTKGSAQLQALLDNQVIGETVANAPRPDLAAAGIGDGNCGFTIRFHRNIDPIYIPFVVVKIHGGDVELPIYSSSNFQQYFRSLFGAYPAAGRTRSVFGGFWSDRIDAGAVLKGRIATGQIDRGQTSHLEQMVANGYSAFPLVSEPYAADLNAAATTILSDLPTSALLRQMFDDRPVALRADLLRGPTEGFSQPSTQEKLPSPCECVAIIVPVGGNTVSLDVVRGSQQFPEFSAAGQSRWVSGGIAAGIELALEQQGLVDREVLVKGQAAVVGPGLIYKVQAKSGAKWLRVLCVPARNVPLEFELMSQEQDSADVAKGKVWA